jgi:hypothetical protein
MPNMNAVISIVLLATSPSVAAEPTIRISCSHTSQVDFDNSVALMDRKPTDAYRRFQELWRRDHDCAILFWGMAISATNPQERQDDALDAIITAVVAGVNDDEWRRIVALP